WVAVAGSMPRARLVTAAKVSGDIRNDVARIDASRVALVTAPTKPLSGIPGKARLVSDRPGHIVVDTTTDGSQLLIVSERFHSGWRGTEDGHAIDLLAVFGDYIGTVVDAGHHHVELRFAPASAR